MYEITTLSGTSNEWHAPIFHWTGDFNVCVQIRTQRRKLIRHDKLRHIWNALCDNNNIHAFGQRHNVCFCHHRGMKTSTVTPSFYYVFNISLYCNDTIPSFIGNLWRVLLPGNHLKVPTESIWDRDRHSDKNQCAVILWHALSLPNSSTTNP